MHTLIDLHTDPVVQWQAHTVFTPGPVSPKGLVVALLDASVVLITAMLQSQLFTLAYVAVAAA